MLPPPLLHRMEVIATVDDSPAPVQHLVSPTNVTPVAAPTRPAHSLKMSRIGVVFCFRECSLHAGLTHGFDGLNDTEVLFPTQVGGAL